MSKKSKIKLFSALVFLLINIGHSDGASNPNYSDFYRCLERSSDQVCLETGQKLFMDIERKYRTDPGFGALKSKLKAADFLADQMIEQLKKATGKQMFAIAGELFEPGRENTKQRKLSVAPAKNFYEASLDIFKKHSVPVELQQEEKKFLVKFYNLKLRILTSEIARAGQSLAIAEPSFKGTYNYVLVLPLLHVSENRPVNIDVLPKWMRQGSQLRVFSDSCLFHFGFEYQAQVFARRAAEIEGRKFSEKDFYRSAAKKSKGKLPRVASDCLKKAIEKVGMENVDERIAIHFEIVQLWIDADNFRLAAAEAKNIVDMFGKHEKAGDAMWLYYYALSRASNADAILSSIDGTIKDPRCKNYRANLMYLKWWALRRSKDQAAQIAALEHQLIADYGDRAITAPIFLSRAVDMMAGQNYAGALDQLEELQKKFPSTNAARQAKKIKEKLKNMQNLN